MERAEEHVYPMIYTGNASMTETLAKGIFGVFSSTVAAISPPSSWPEVLGCVVAIFTAVSLSLDIRRKLEEGAERRRERKKKETETIKSLALK